MNDWKTIVQLARHSLITLGATVLVMLALSAGAFMLKDRQLTQLAQEQLQLSGLKGGLAQKQADLADLQTKTGRFSQLRQQGLLGAVDREAWIEALLASVARTGLAADSLNYTLETPRALTPAIAGAADPTGLGEGALVHDLVLELKNIHEDELLSLLRDYQTHVRGVFRVQSCTLSKPTERGLLARCTLRFFNLPDGQPSPA
jgi:hypothetical protein